MQCKHEDVTVAWRVLETGNYDRAHNLICGLTNREWGFPDSITCAECGYEFTEAQLNDINIEG